jgi:hypothetical protein
MRHILAALLLGASMFLFVVAVDRHLAHADVRYKHMLYLHDGSHWATGEDGVLDIRQDGDAWVRLELGNGNVFRFPREDIREYVETAQQVP